MSAKNLHDKPKTGHLNTQNQIRSNKQKAINASTSIRFQYVQVKYWPQKIQLVNFRPVQTALKCVQRFYGALDGRLFNCFILCLPLVFTRITLLFITNATQTNEFPKQTQIYGGQFDIGRVSFVQTATVTTYIPCDILFINVNRFLFFNFRWAEEIPQDRNQSQVTTTNVLDVFARLP